jgi:hypothetical protein
MTHSEASVPHVDRSQDGSSRPLLIVSIVVWALLCIGRALSAASDASGGAAGQVGAFVGALLATLLLAFLGRSVVRLLRRRAVLSPLWTPSLFFIAAGLSLLLLAAAGGQGAG